MDFFPDQATLTLWLTNYGSIVLFVLLALGIVALPVPEETLMIMAGIFMRNGEFNIHATIASALGGSICGITLSYIIGYTGGNYLLRQYGSSIGLTKDRLDTVHIWFEKLGTWALFVGYFIPGVRHFTGFSAGLTKLSYRQFALFAYSGAFFWVSTFLSIGYYFGHYCCEAFSHLEMGLTEVLLYGLGCVFLIYFIVKFKRFLNS